MLQLKPNCELCDVDLPADSAMAMICTYECTFCVNCVDQTLHNVCPNCGGGFSPRPIRPKIAHRPNVNLANQPASTERVHSKYSLEEIEAFTKALVDTLPADR